MDLSKQPPRRPSNFSIVGTLNLARMTDKARAYNDETLGEYVYGDNSGLDKILLEFLDISADDFADAAGRYNDEALGEWVLKVSEKTEEEINSFNDFHMKREPEDDAGKGRLKARVEKFAPGSTDIKTVLQSIELDDWGDFREVDLTAHAPRTPYCQDVAGIYAAARLAGKARADKCGKLHDYIYNCPIDEALLKFLNISAEAFQESAYNNPNNLELTDWVLQNTNRSRAQISAFNAMISQKGPETDELRDIFKKSLSKVAPRRTDITTWFDLIDLDDEHSYNTVDLTRHAPRSPYDLSVGGIASFARLIDKGRAALSDTLGDFWFGNDSGLDRHVLEFLGVSEETFRAVLQENPTDADILSWLEKTAPRSTLEIEAFNEQISQLGPPEERLAWFQGMISKIDPSRTDIDTFFALTHLDDQVSFARLKARV